MKNEFGQPIGLPLPEWPPRPMPAATVLTGRYCRLEPLDFQSHGGDLLEAFADSPQLWTYMAVGPMESLSHWQETIDEACIDANRAAYAVVANDRAMGTLSLITSSAENGVTEIGWVAFSPALQRTREATEASALLLRYVFDELGYRRCEWKCDLLNAPSRAAAERLGFRFEGVFRQAVVYRGRNRDTCWLSMLDSEWPGNREALDSWLLPENFDSEGRQLRPLRAG